MEGNIQESTIITSIPNQLNQTMDNDHSQNNNNDLLKMNIGSIKPNQPSFSKQEQPTYDQHPEGFLDFDIDSQIKPETPNPNQDLLELTLDNPIDPKIQNQNTLNDSNQTPNQTNLQKENSDFLNDQPGNANFENQDLLGNQESQSDILGDDNISDLSQSFMSFLGDNSSNFEENKKKDILKNLPQFLNKISIQRNLNFTQSKE